MKPIHERELRELATCAVCDRKIGETGTPLFWKVIAERHLVDTEAVRRQTGLTMMCGGHAGIAAAMGPDEPMTIPVKMDSDAVVYAGAASRDIREVV